MSDKQTIPLTEEAVKAYLDNAIRHWRKQRHSFTRYERIMASHYIDAYQSMRTSLFGELLPKE